MDFMSLHSMKMRELEEYRQMRKKADVIGTLIAYGLLGFCCLVWYLRFKFGV